MSACPAILSKNVVPTSPELASCRFAIDAETVVMRITMKICNAANRISGWLCDAAFLANLDYNTYREQLVMRGSQNFWICVGRSP